MFIDSLLLKIVFVTLILWHKLQCPHGFMEYPLGNRVVGSSVTVGGGFIAGCALLSVGWKLVGYSPIVTLLLTNMLATDLFC